MPSLDKKRLLLLNGAGAGKGESNLIALSEGDEIIAQYLLAGRGASERFAPAVESLLKESGWDSPPDGVAAIIGPGSFTGLRASLSLASGLACGWNTQPIGLRLGDAVRASIELSDVREKLAVLCLARRGRIFVDPPQGDEIYALPISEISLDLWQHIAGDAVFGADALAELVGENGCLIGKNAPILHPIIAPSSQAMRKVAYEVLLGERKNYPLMPLYIDPPELRFPAHGLRPAPQ